MKIYRVIYSQFSIEDLLNIDGYISNILQNESAANNISQTLLTNIGSLSYLPYRHMVYKNDIRKMVVKRYSVFYTVDESNNSVNIIRILFNGMDANNILDNI